MAETKFTKGAWTLYPGQWGYHGDEDDPDDNGGGWHIICGPHEPGHWTVKSHQLIELYDEHYASDGDGFDEMHANAHLIAAAPDLYEALEITTHLLAMFGSPNDDTHVMGVEKATAALRKARGE